MEIKKVPGNILGIFWTTASWVPSDENNGSISITNEDENILKEIKNFLLKYEINYSYYNGPPDKKNRKNYKYEYYRMKIYNYHIINLLRNRYKWRGRREEKRYYPVIDNNKQEIDFLKYYIKDMGTYDIRKVSWGNGKQKRYRIYCHHSFINKLNKKINKIVDVAENKPQKHYQSDVLKVLYYQNQNDVEKILNFID